MILPVYLTFDTNNSKLFLKVDYSDILVEDWDSIKRNIRKELDLRKLKQNSGSIERMIQNIENKMSLKD